MNDSVAVLLKKVQRALDSYQFSTATDVAEQALALMDNTGVGMETCAGGHYLAGIAYYESGSISNAKRHFEQARVCYEELDDQLHEQLCQLRIAECYQWRGEYRQGRHLSLRALAWARDWKARQLEADALGIIGIIALKSGEPAAAVVDLESAVALFGELGDESGVQTNRMWLGYVMTMEGHVEKGRTMMQQSEEYFIRTGDISSLAKVLNTLAYTYYAQDDLAKAGELLQRSAELEEQCQSHALALSTWINLGLIKLHSREWRSAKITFIRTRELAISLGDRVTENLSILYSGVLTLYSSDPGEALRLFQLGHDNFTDLAYSEVKLAEYFLAIGLLATSHETIATQVWAKRKAMNQMKHYQDDFKLMVDLLEFMLSPVFKPEQLLEPGARKLAEKWRMELKHGLEQL